MKYQTLLSDWRFALYLHFPYLRFPVLAFSAPPLIASAGRPTPYRLVPAHFYPCSRPIPLSDHIVNQDSYQHPSLYTRTVQDVKCTGVLYFDEVYGGWSNVRLRPYAYISRRIYGGDKKSAKSDIRRRQLGRLGLCPMVVVTEEPCKYPHALSEWKARCYVNYYLAPSQTNEISK